ncbi:MAG: uroporphyrinogen-III C-methyltransferase [Herbaspirillum sp.]
MTDTPLPSDSSANPNEGVVLPPFAADIHHEAPMMPISADRGARHWLIYILLLVLAALFAWQWWNTRIQMHDLRGEIAQRLRSGDSTNQETKVLVKSIRDSEDELRGKVSVLESKQTEAQSQQLALEQLYQDLSKNRDDWALSEVEQVLSTASQQLQLAGNVSGALIALQNADKDLSREEKPQFISIRRAIANDIETLKSVPTVDVTGIALRLDNAIAQVDSMRLLADEKPVAPTSAKLDGAKQTAVKATEQTVEPVTVDENGNTDWFALAKSKWQVVSSGVWNEIKQLVRIRDVADPEALLLSPTQAYYVRENLKIRLLSARLALLSRNEAVFRSDLLVAQDTITRYFDVEAKQTQAVQTLLKQVQKNDLTINMPTLAASIKAVRDYKAQP